MSEYNTYVGKNDKQLLAVIENEFKSLNSKSTMNKTNVGDRILINVKFDSQEELETFNSKLISKNVHARF